GVKQVSLVEDTLFRPAEAAKEAEAAEDPADGGYLPNAMSPRTALNCCLAGLVLLLLPRRCAGATRWAAAGAVLLIVFLAVSDLLTYSVAGPAQNRIEIRS